MWRVGWWTTQKCYHTMVFAALALTGWGQWWQHRVSLLGLGDWRDLRSRQGLGAEAEVHENHRRPWTASGLP